MFIFLASICVYGGGNRKQQINLIMAGVEIVVATPGRFNDLLDNDFLKMRDVTYVVSVSTFYFISFIKMLHGVNMQPTKMLR